MRSSVPLRTVPPPTIIILCVCVCNRLTTLYYVYIYSIVTIYTKLKNNVLKTAENHNIIVLPMYRDDIKVVYCYTCVIYFVGRDGLPWVIEMEKH